MCFRYVGLSDRMWPRVVRGLQAGSGSFRRYGSFTFTHCLEIVVRSVERPFCKTSPNIARLHGHSAGPVARFRASAMHGLVPAALWLRLKREASASLGYF